MEAPYQIIAEHLVSACPPGFERAWLKAELNEGHARTEYWCEHKGQETQPKIDSLGSFKIAEAFHTLRDQMKQDGKPVWRRCTFGVRPDGTFKFDVEYDD